MMDDVRSKKEKNAQHELQLDIRKTKTMDMYVWCRSLY